MKHYTIWILAASKDSSIVEKLRAHLKGAGRYAPMPIVLQINTEVDPGKDTREQFFQRLREANVIVPIITTNFLASSEELFPKSGDMIDVLEENILPYAQEQHIPIQRIRVKKMVQDQKIYGEEPQGIFVFEGIPAKPIETYADTDEAYQEIVLKLKTLWRKYAEDTIL